MSGNPTNQKFNRYEFKYLLNQQLTKAVEQEIQYFMDFDPFIANIPEKKYFVRSLYFDDPFYTAFHDKIDGIKARFKFRVRNYQPLAEQDSPMYLEMKGRYNNFVLKERVLVPDETKKLLLHGHQDRFIKNMIADIGNNTVKEHFCFEVFKKNINPKVWVDYLRRPYVSKFDYAFRLTFDTDLRAHEGGNPYLGRPERTRRVYPGYTILEIKFAKNIPGWFHRIIKNYQLKRVSVSKYCACIDKMGSADMTA